MTAGARAARKGPSRPSLGFHTDRLPYDDIPTRCDEYMLCVAAGRTGPSFWAAWRETATDEDREHAVDWDEGVELLRASGLTIGLDSNGFAHIRYASAEARDQARAARKILRESRERSGDWSV